MMQILRRAWARYKIRCLEIHLDDQTDALEHVRDEKTRAAIARARRQTQRELQAAQAHHQSLQARHWSRA